MHANLLHDSRPPEDRQIGNVEVRPAELSVLIGGNRASLTVREFQVFFVLFERYDRVVLRAEMYELVWGARMPRRDRSVDVFVRKVRAKLAAVDPSRQFIHTHFGIGYRFSPVPAATEGEPPPPPPPPRPAP